MSVVFYYSPMSSASTTHWALEELGVPFEKVKVDLKAGDQNKEAFLAVNPNGKVPAIVHDGVPVFESAAIIIHLGECFGVEKGLFPAAGPQRGEALKWVVWCNATLCEALWRYQRNTSDRIPAEERNTKAAAVAKVDVEKQLDILETSLKGKDYLVANAFSLVDAHVAGFAGYLQMVGFDVKQWPSVSAWVERCRSRPAFARAMGA
jgi:glutathione S-transferase